MRKDGEFAGSLRRKDIDEETLEAGLLAAVYRKDCPDTMELSEYHMGLLAEPEQERVRTHLDRCPHCQAELARLSESLVEDAPMAVPAHTDEGSGWIKERGFEWRQLRKTGQVIIRLLAETLLLPSPQLAIAVKGQAEAEQADVIHRITLGPDQADDLDLEAIIRRSDDDPQLCTLTIRVEIPSRWPDLAGAKVRVAAGDWQAEGVTGGEGEIAFGGLPEDSVDMLFIEVNP